MPYLQLDVPNHYAADVKQRLARRLGDLYAGIMQTTPGIVTVAFRELAQGSLWRCGEGDPKPAAVLKCDIRRGRSAEQRTRLAKALIGACVEALGLSPESLSVAFTQHAGDEVGFRIDGGPSNDWTPAEAETAM
jgi:phenylpyruvate tautomerase PptA (4-oxalocrotonate tautomerase family)